MMKRILSAAIAAVVLVMSLCGCSAAKKLTAFGLYSKAVSDVANAGGVEMDVDITISFDNEQLSGLTTTVGMNMKYSGDRSQVTMDAGEAGTTVTTVIGSHMYVELPQSGIKQHYTLPDDSAELVDSGEEAGLPKLGEALFANIEIVENDDGTRSVTVFPKPEDLSSILSGITGELGEQLTVTFDDLMMKMNFDSEDRLDSMDLDCKMVYNVMGIEIAGNMSAVYKLVNLGSAPEIEMPDDLKSFQEMSEYKP